MPRTSVLVQPQDCGSFCISTLPEKWMSFASDAVSGTAIVYWPCTVPLSPDTLPLTKTAPLAPEPVVDSPDGTPLKVSVVDFSVPVVVFALKFTVTVTGFGMLVPLPVGVNANVWVVAVED